MGANIDINISSPIVAIAGPTASGKSEFALALCKKLHGTIINFDSMQVYRELRVLTARPDSATEKIVPHKMYGYISGVKRGSVMLWRKKALKEIQLSLKSGLVPVLVGGTGLYLKALIEGISDVPITISKFRKKSEIILEKEGIDVFYKRVQKVEPNLESLININDAQRLIRLYTVWLQTGKTLSEWREDNKPKNNISNNFLKVKLSPERELLRSKINKRFYKMLEKGALEEVKLIEGYDFNLPIMKAHGVRELLAVLKKRISIEEAAKITINHTNQYAKRQETWFRHQYKADYEIINYNNDIDKYCSNILSIYKKLY